MKKLKEAVVFLLVGILLAGMSPMPFRAGMVNSGTIISKEGDTIAYGEESFYKGDMGPYRRLAISGKGAMPDYKRSDCSPSEYSPWYKNLQVHHIVIEEGITAVGNCTFCDMYSLLEVTLPEGLVSIGEKAFWDCGHIEYIDIPDSVVFIGADAFGYNPYLKIRCNSGSYAMDYAIENGIPYKLMDAVEVSGISLNYESLTLQKGMSETIYAAIQPEDATDREIEWVSSNPQVATVSDGTVRGILGGTAQITAKSKNGVRASCTVIVPYEITYVLDGGTNHENNPEHYYGNPVILEKPVRKGYLFGGWFSDSTWKTEVTDIRTGDKTVYAKWEKVSVGRVSKPSLANLEGKKLKIKFQKLDDAAGYELQYAKDSKFENAVTRTVKASTKTYTVKTKKTYYVRIRAYQLDSAGEKVYGKWSAAAKIKIVK